MRKIRDFIIYSFIALLVSSCQERGTPLFTSESWKPRAFRKQIIYATPNGDSSYDVGFQDGCRTAASVIGEGLYRVRGAKMDAQRLGEDPMYLRGFQDASNVCTLSMDWEVH